MYLIQKNVSVCDIAEVFIVQISIMLFILKIQSGYIKVLSGRSRPVLCAVFRFTNQSH